MQVFELYIDDDRSAVPSLMFVEAGSPQRVWAIAQRHLQSSPHFSRVEVYRGNEHLFGIRAGRRDDGQSDVTTTLN
jgi:hypothetical protein